MSRKGFGLLREWGIPGKRFIKISGFLVLLFAFFPAEADPLDQWFWRNPSPQGNSLTSVAFGQSRFVAVGAAGAILTSSNGTNWVSASSPTTNALANVAYAATSRPRLAARWTTEAARRSAKVARYRGLVLSQRDKTYHAG